MPIRPESRLKIQAKLDIYWYKLVKNYFVIYLGVMTKGHVYSRFQYPDLSPIYRI